MSRLETWRRLLHLFSGDNKLARFHVWWMNTVVKGKEASKYQKRYKYGKAKHELRVTTSNPQVASPNPRVTSSKPQIRELKTRIPRLRARVGRLKALVRRLKAWVEAIEPRGT